MRLGLQRHTLKQAYETALYLRTTLDRPQYAAYHPYSSNGIGLPEDYDASGERLSERRSMTAGAGLGLSISRAIVAAHGGTLRLDRVGPGTAWHLDLPIGTGRRDSEPAPAASNV